MFKKPTVQHAAIRSTVPGFCAFLVALAFGGAVRANEPVIRMAGTFNNWSTNNDDYRLTKVDDHYELVRFWPCGKYEFKFVFDGSWSKHLGMGDDGKLGQPGRDIELLVKQSGTFAICLELDRKQFRLEPRASDRPIPIIRVLNSWSPRITLDASLSLAGAAGPIKSYKWRISSQTYPPFDKEFVTKKEGTPEPVIVDIPMSLDYRIELTVDDGQQTAWREKRQHLPIGNGFVIRDEVPAPYGKPIQIEMAPLANNLFGAIYRSEKSDDIKLDFSSQLKPSNGILSIGPLKTKVEAKTDYLVVLDMHRRGLTLSKSWRQFEFTPARFAESLKGITVERVEVVGDFNNWRAGDCELWAVGPPVTFKRFIEIPDGLYHYKFLVNGCIALEDPGADPKYRESDGKGGFNSGFRVGVDPSVLGTAKLDDVNENAVKHEPMDPGYFASIGYKQISFRMRTLADDAKAVSAQFFNDDQSTRGEPIPLSKVLSHDGFDYWSTICLPERWPILYTFLIEDGKEHCILDADGPHSFAANEKIALLPRPFAPDTRMSFETPDWAKRAVWYQIFPERFRNGDASNDPPTTVPWRHEWYKPYKGSAEGTKAQRHKGTEGKTYVESGDFWDFIFDRRYGGDIQGVKEKLPYLQKLGITAIYFNPMFLAESMHKYDASDYRHIDDYFGVKGSLKKVKGETTDPKTWQWSETDKIFLDFVKEAHRQGFKVVLDGVFNHVGRDFWAFKDVMKNGEKSEYVGWFDITSFKPFHYKAWDKDDGSLPRLKHDDALGLAVPVREHLFAVTRRWMDPNGDGDPSDGIDGWRLDVAADINANFWRDWRKLVKSINPNGYIVAEIWEESKSWLDGQTFDAVMNYPFARAAQRFFVNQKKVSKPSEFQAELQRNLDWYAPQVNYVLQNLYCSHDTDRVASMFMNPDLEYDKANRQQDNGPNYVVARPTSECYHKLKAMVAFQMTFLGAPMIYYGDEVGMYGADDPSDRKPMWWEDLMPYDDPDERIEPGLFEYHQRLIAIRNTFPALQLGSFEPIIARDDHAVFAFCRSLGSERVVVVFNNSDKPHRLDLPSPWPEGTHVDRADDPKVYEVVDAKDAASRAVVRPTGKHKPTLNVENGRLHGSMIEPRTAAIFVKS
ncbi:MAG: alpha amylase N-terminal ig-like domain-containing protein [Planctomycetes bacterium]|nr:alpha amylase N-terminal ig-like domain-containing protein [Planctomycetota bacterium]